MKNLLNPKNIILNQIKEQFESNKITGIKELYILLPVNTSKAEIILKNICDKTEKMNYDFDKKSVLVKIFLKKFGSHCEKSNINPESYIVKINLKTDTIDCFIKDVKNNIHTLNF